MNEKNTQKSTKLEEISHILDDLKAKADLTGVLLSFRDGELILDNFQEDVDTKTFAAMSASIIGSAEGLGKTVGDRVISKIITELEENTIIIVGCGERFVLTLVIDDGSRVDLILSEIDEYLEKIINLYLG